MILKRIFLPAVLLAFSLMAQGKDEWTLDPGVRVKCLKVLREGLASEEFWPSMHAAEALSVAGFGKEVQEFLSPKLETENDDQRRCGLARELVRSGDKAKSTVMMDILQKEDAHGHVHAAESLYKVGWSGGFDPLKTAFSETDQMPLKIMAASALAKYDREGSGKEAIAFLRNTLKREEDPAVFRLPAWVLSRIGVESDRELIRSRLKDAGDPLVHAFLEHALAALGDDDGKKALLENLKSDDPVIRTYAAVFAGESGIFEAVPDLVGQLDHENLDARIRAAQALLTLDL
ncbi:HEAT repeat domain-containing protein [Verrucomicrobiales bacterium BCK34]|nr:HEAT repeat domain-containing protein [Verrucomicrobiales bacterium BCK34]